MDASLLINPYYGLTPSRQTPHHASRCFEHALRACSPTQARRLTLGLSDAFTACSQSRAPCHVKAAEIMHLEATLKFGPAFIYNARAPRERRSEHVLLNSRKASQVPGRTGQDSQMNFLLHAECVLLDEIFIRTSSPA